MTGTRSCLLSINKKCKCLQYNLVLLLTIYNCGKQVQGDETYFSIS